ncbi:cytochrome c oxidase accessory protein CcoG [Salinimicrobium marinum]|uniref:Cytochrome c oxidase accessory protein CcoG n=1 Tax=Salinimicrobium marinum TaxID=680283 RepID=A0A918S6T9_9FLAO|nr:cytochrome c oxidase accessory protein CcoG [Salinimicrobium marinum]GHA23970.1 cytochrome c oxidase accessory protein CcoG [Salinimicrobium marinum]
MSKAVQEDFRDKIGTMTKEGKRAWVYPKKPSGKFHTYRTWFTWFLLIFLLTGPFIFINGNQFMLFNVMGREFSIFGFPFWPQDFYLGVTAMIIAVVFITLFTTAFGRIFCGWICPQTIFMEMVFRKIEYWIEGDRGAQMRLDKQEWTSEKIRKKGFKWFIFFLVSFVIANVFLAYLIGSKKLLQYVTTGPLENLSTFVALLIFTGIFYFVFAWFREQVCTIACPYGRLQSVLLDKKSVVVAYNNKRGEREKGRSKFKKNENRQELGKGDCIDCFQCVHVCPTGIDIRNGTQLECINCTACIDACDEIMEKVDLPKGLIGFYSEENIEKEEKSTFTPRMQGFAAIMFVLVGLLAGMLFLRNDVEATVLRLPGQLYEMKTENMVSNVYTFKLINKTTSTIQDVHFELLSHNGTIQSVTHQDIKIPEKGYAEGTLFIEINQAILNGEKENVEIGIYSGKELIETTKTNFMGPRSFR